MAGKPRKSGLPSFFQELEKLLDIPEGLKHVKAPPTNVTQPLPMPMIDLAKVHDETVITFKDLSEEQVDKLKSELNKWKQDPLKHPIVYADPVVTIAQQEIAETFQTLSKAQDLILGSLYPGIPKKYLSGKEHIEVSAKQMAAQVEASKQAMMGAQFKQEILGLWPPSKDPVTKEQVDQLNYQHVYNFKKEQQKFTANYSDLEQQVMNSLAAKVLTEKAVMPAEDTLYKILTEDLGIPAESLAPPAPQEEVEYVELTISGLTKQEAEAMLKQVKTKEKPVLVHQTVRKEIGTKSEPIVVWPFESSSMQVNGEPLLYKTQLNKDGTLSCNCMGWTRGSAKSESGRFCKHTRAIEDQYKVADLYKKWKKGEPLGDDFAAASMAVANASSKTLFKALKEDAGDGSSGIFKAKRIVEI